MKTYDFIGIGIGPFNLSIAALAEGLPGFSTLFLERKPRFSWHPGMMVPDCAMQTCFLKDLVSAVAPTSRHSFLNYLVQHKKFYRFLTTEQRAVSREEFADYLGWAAERLDNLAFNSAVQRVSFNDEAGVFDIETQRARFRARHLCIGIGKQINLPACVMQQSDSCFHASEMALRAPSLEGKRVTVVGGGQSGADLFLNIFRSEWGQPARLDWVSRRNNYNALDEAAFANEYFTPDYLESFATLNADARRRLLAEQKMTSDGITAEALLTIYRELYHRFDVLRETPWAQLMPSRSVTHLRNVGSSQRLTLQHHLDGGEEHLESDIVIFATGYRTSQPEFLAPLAARIRSEENGEFSMNTDFTLAWDGPAANRLFAVNAGMHSLGIAEPQLSLMAWRAARILNAAHPDKPFDIATTPGIIHWRSCPEQNAAPARPAEPNAPALSGDTRSGVSRPEWTRTT
ncbi:lysine N(6)-hydroxylase/L-ornithine N(5)-oxygenase family protein [Erwinia sp. HR93]|uniref:lysine N(6)-hydroxylase/L-ornithine N(5)-oxygenase family protein n=1 Tax=Erwinia sp. HR93 TaxID=3094840 RepID=UPI002ADECF29|nr:SidA/IucD/PvdA family monooxygenase [Erwinia sp. HR93]MEA1063030.1 SidA/IucD/PvdA family monooxygenase [Erwinia sp. HR93]